MDVTIRIMLTEPTHAMSDEVRATTIKIGDPIEVFFSDKWANLVNGEYVAWCNNGNENSGLIHILGVPDAISLNEFAGRMLMPEEVVLDFPFAEPYVKLRRRTKFGVALADLPNAFRRNFLRTREATVTWAMAKQYIKRKLVTSTTDTSSDTRQVLTDGDILFGERPHA